MGLEWVHGTGMVTNTENPMQMTHPCRKRCQETIRLVWKLVLLTERPVVAVGISWV